MFSIWRVVTILELKWSWKVEETEVPVGGVNSVVKRRLAGAAEKEAKLLK